MRQAAFLSKGPRKSPFPPLFSLSKLPPILGSSPPSCLFKHCRTWLLLYSYLPLTRAGNGSDSVIGVGLCRSSNLSRSLVCPQCGARAPRKAARSQALGIRGGPLREGLSFFRWSLSSALSWSRPQRWVWRAPSWRLSSLAGSWAAGTQRAAWAPRPFPVLPGSLQGPRSYKAKSPPSVFWRWSRLWCW